jgi:ABC-type proline/glycine betaine transport system substrate-binding protein
LTICGRAALRDRSSPLTADTPRHSFKTFQKHLAIATLSFGLAATSALADAESCKTVRIADLGWTDIMLTDATSELILSALGYEPEEKLLGLDVSYVSLREKNMDICQGNWRPVQNLTYKEFFDKGWVEDLRASPVSKTWPSITTCSTARSMALRRVQTPICST